MKSIDFKKNGKNIIRFSVINSYGEELIDIREWHGIINEPSGEVVYQPTKSGFTLKIPQFLEFKHSMESFGDYIDEKDKKSSEVER